MHLLMRLLVLLPLWTSQMSNQIIAMSDFRDTLIMQGLEVITILLKIWLLLIIDSTTSAEIGVLVFSRR